MYQELDKNILSKASGSLKGSASKKKNVEKFLRDNVPNNRQKELDNADFKRKTIHLDNIQKTWSHPSQTRKHRNFLTCKEKRELKVFDLKKDGHRFEDYLPLHRMWQDYMKDITDISKLEPVPGARGIDKHLKLMKADFHGCYMTVRKSRCPSLVGVTGILLQETRNMFKLVTKENRLKCIPKENSLFSFELEGKLLTIHGNSFKVKASERTRKKFKTKATTDI